MGTLPSASDMARSASAFAAVRRSLKELVLPECMRLHELSRLTEEESWIAEHTRSTSGVAAAQ